jgi:DNA-binding response OmpR family regulator
MPDRPFPSGTRVPEIILHGRRLCLSETQVRVLAVLLARLGHLVSDAELLASQESMGRDPRTLWHTVSHLRSVIAPHGFTISRVRCAGYRLRHKESPS